MMGTCSRSGLLFCVFALMLFPTPLRSQAEPPADVARAFFRALEDQQWDRAAVLVLPDLLADAGSGRLANFEARFSAHDTLALSSLLRWEFAGVESLGQMRALSDAELMARHLEAIDGRAGCAEVTGDRYAAPLVRRRVLGVVREGEWAHVVYRESHANLDLSAAPDFYRHPAKALLLGSTPDGWRIANVDELRVSIYCDPMIVPAE